jgi:O-antigen/teichoic acid export membrane protein
LNANPDDRARVEPGLLREFGSGAALAFALKACAFVGMYGVAIAAARQLGVSNAGQFFLLLTVVTVVSTLARLGFDKPLVRLVASLHTARQSGRIWPATATAFWLVAIASSIAALALWLASEPAAARLSAGEMTGASLRAIVWAIPALALSGLISLAYQGLHRIGFHLLLLSVLTPFLMLALIGVKVILGLTWDFPALYAIAAGLTLAFALLSWRRTSTASIFAFDLPAIRPILASSRATFVVVAAQLLIGWAPTLLLGIFASGRQVAIYHVADRTALSISFVLIAVNVIAAPKFASLYSAGNLPMLRRAVVWSTGLMTAASLPIALVFFLLPEQVLGLFGAGFDASADALRVLTAGQLVATAMGSMSNLLLMTGHERDLRNLIVLGAAANVIAGAWAASSFGAIGSASVTAASMGVVSLLAATAVRRRLGFWGWSRG